LAIDLPGVASDTAIGYDGSDHRTLLQDGRVTC
jgi:hypothetical protein